MVAGGLADQLQRLVQRESAELSFWQHKNRRKKEAELCEWETERKRQEETEREERQRETQREWGSYVLWPFLQP